MNAMCLRQPLHALEGKYLKTAIIRFVLLIPSQLSIVYAVDIACDVVAHAEARLPLMAEAMWGNRRGCFEKPCPERPPRVQALILNCMVYNIPLHALIYSADFSSARASTHTQSTSHLIKCCVGAQLCQEFGAPPHSDNRQVCGW